MKLKKLFPFMIAILLSVLLSLLISHVTIRYIEQKQIATIETLLDNVIYKPQQHIEHLDNLQNNNNEENKRILDFIDKKHPEIMGISYIKNGKYYYGNNGSISNNVPNYIKEVINKNIPVKFFTDPYNQNNLIYIFKYDNGYYIINFHSKLLNDFSHNAITNYQVKDHNDKSSTSYLYYSLTNNVKHLHLMITSGLKFNKFIALLFSSFIMSLLFIYMVSFILTTYFDSKRVLNRKMKKAVTNNEFIPFYQSIYSKKQNKFIAAEVLCRWHSNGIIIPPSEFIADLEKTDEIKEVTFSLIKRSFDTIKRANINKDFMLSFNFTVTMLLDKDFMKKIIHFIKENPMIKNRIIIELTESENNFIYLNEIKEVMYQLKKESVLLSIDDVGTGYSNLITIQELPFDIMKIDRCFISDNFAVSQSNMLETLANLGDSLNLMIVAEGIETAAELNKINRLNIDLCQGFYYSTPCNSSEFTHRTISEPHLYN
ncbi:EAL domain-containing protein [Photobacterium piscicola]|uniref:EAL domain-containing protein n=2 Tax=Photobacterium piscicola TaxID=1378299 RepID=A0ABU6LN03_9GAMM|nr:EAL domain-containing protein [Photobacterium piscicola]